MEASRVQSDPWLVCSPEVPCRDHIEDKIYSFSTLKNGWDYGEGRAPQRAVIEKAIDIYRIGKRLGMDAEVFPVTSGEIEVSFSLRDHFMDIVVRDDEGLEFSYEIGIGEKYDRITSIENISLDEVEKRLGELAKLCGVSELSETITIQGRKDLRIAVFGIMEEQFQFLTKNVSQIVILP